MIMWGKKKKGLQEIINRTVTITVVVVISDKRDDNESGQERMIVEIIILNRTNSSMASSKIIPNHSDKQVLIRRIMVIKVITVAPIIAII